MLPGTIGAVVAVLLFASIASVSRAMKKLSVYNLEPGGKAGAFEPLLVKYIRLAEFVIGLATGSIVLLVGSTVLHEKGGHLPAFYANPLVIIAFSAIYGVGFMAWMIYIHEQNQHGNPHTRFQYVLSESLGLSALLCFMSGYLWLIIAVTQ
jgi:hypothetical protein